MTSPSGPEPAAGKRNEWLLILFTGWTNIADAVTAVALPLLTLQLTREPLAVTAVAMMLSLPWLLTALHIGVFVDRMDRRRLLVGAQVARVALVGLLLLTFLGGTLSLPLVYAAALFLGLADVIASLSGVSIVPSAIPRARWQTASARITAVEYLFNSFIGSPIGGLLVAVGFAVALTTSGLSYLLAAVLLLLLAGNFAVARSTEPRPVHTEIRDGLVFLWRHRLLRTMALLITIMAGCWAAWFALIPAYAVGGPLGLSAREYGILLTCLGAGGVAGSLVVGRLNSLLGRRWSMFVDIVGTFALVAVPAILPATPDSAWAIGAAAAVAGAGGTMWTVNSRVITQTLVPHDMLGRFSAASRVVAWGMAPIAALAAGALAQLVSYRLAFGAFAVLCLLLVYPFLRVITQAAVAEVDQPAPEPEPAAGSAT